MTKPASKRQFLIQWLILGIALLLVGGYGVYDLNGDYQRIDRQEREWLDARARIVEENLGHQIEAIGLALSSIRDDAPLWKEQAEGWKLAERHLKTMANAMTSVHTFLVINADGTVFASNQDELRGKDFSQRDYFQRVVRLPNPETLYVGEPFQSVLGVFAMNVARMIAQPNGEFGGIVAATLDPNEFRILLNSMRYTPDLSTGLVHGKGKIFLYLPEQPALLGLDVSRPGTFFSQHQASGQADSIITGMDSVHGSERMAALHTLRPAALHLDEPIIVAIARDLEPLFAPWRRQVYQQSLLLGALAIVSVLGLMAAQRRQWQRQIAEQALVEDANRLRHISMLASDLIYSCYRAEDGLFHFDWMVGNAAHLFGDDTDELKACGCWRCFVVAEDQPLFARHITNLQPGQSSEVILGVTHRDGSLRYLRSFAQVEEEPASPGRHRLYGALQDMTQYKQAEKKLAESENRFRTIFNAVSDAIFIHDAETGRIIDVNDRMCEMYGHTRETALVCGPDDLSAGTPPYSAAEALEQVHRTIAQGPQTFEWRARAGDGHLFWVEVSLRLALIDGQQRILAVVRDISVRKQAEERLERFFALIPDMVCIASTNGYFLKINPEWQAALGYTEQELLSTPFIEFIHPDDREATLNQVAQQVAGEVTMHFVNRYRCKDGYYKWLEWRATPAEDQLLFASARDVSVLKAHEAELDHYAHYDLLTDVPNRRLLTDRLGQALAHARRSGKSLAICYLDLDGFKPINDQYGHTAGDGLLIEMVERLKGVLRAEDTLARLGGDEFVLLFTNLTQHAESQHILDRVLTVVSAPVPISDTLVNVSASIGVTLYPADDVDADILLRHADQAMYRAKQAGKNRYHIYDPSDDRQ